jgi:hypothetical protein
MNLTIDLSPKEVEILPRGVHPCREYRVFNHEREQWFSYREFLYETAHGAAHIALAPGRSLQQGTSAADRLLKSNSTSMIVEAGVYGTVNSVRIHEDLYSGSPLALVVARSGAFTEWRTARLLEILTGDGQTRACGLHHSMASRPALVCPCEPFAERSQLRIRPGHVPLEAKRTHAAPSEGYDELFLAGKMANRWSDTFYQSVLSNVNYHLWVTNDEKDAMCLSLLPMLLGLKMDVIAITATGLRKCNPRKDILPPEMAAYRFKSPDGTRRLAGIAFDQESWRNPKTADALLHLCKALREAGALVFVAVIPPGYRQNGIADFFARYCVHGNVLDFAPIVGLLNRSVYVDHDYEISLPAPGASCDLKSLSERAQAFFEIQERFRNQAFAEVPRFVMDNVVLEIGGLANDQKRGQDDLNDFRALSLQEQTLRWAQWMAHNPFQAKLDRELDAFVPPAFRGRSEAPAQFSYEDATKGRMPPEKPKV